MRLKRKYGSYTPAKNPEQAEKKLCEDCGEYKEKVIQVVRDKAKIFGNVVMITRGIVDICTGCLRRSNYQRLNKYA